MLNSNAEAFLRFLQMMGVFLYIWNQEMSYNAALKILINVKICLIPQYLTANRILS
jgi:hypothetical protein